MLELFNFAAEVWIVVVPTFLLVAFLCAHAHEKKHPSWGEQSSRLPGQEDNNG